MCWTAKATPEKLSIAPASWCGIGAKRARSGRSCSITSILRNRERHTDSLVVGRLEGGAKVVDYG